MQKIKNIIIPVLILFILVYFFSLIFKGYESNIYDLKVNLFLEKIESQIVFIDIDQKSIDFYNKENQMPWPWARSFYANAIDFFNKAGATVVFIDLILSEESIWGEEEDNKLALSMKKFGKVFLPFYFNNNKNLEKKFNLFLSEKKMPYHISPPVKTGILLPVYNLLTACKGSGFVSQSQGKDSIIRNLNHFVKYMGKTVTSLPLSIALSIKPDLNLNKVPFSRTGDLKLKFYKEESFLTYSIDEIIQSNVRLIDSKDPIIAPELFKDKIIFIGSSAPGLLDLRPTPLDPKFPGYQINGTSLLNFLNNDYIYSINIYIQWIIILLLVFFLHYLLINSNNYIYQIFISLFTLLLVIFTNFILYKFNYNIDLLPFLYGIFFTSIYVLYYKYQIEGKEKRFLKKAFQNYLSPILLSELVNNPHKLSIGGEKKQLTVFFSDLAGFTTISEKLPPEEVINLLNSYLERMTNVVLKNKGYLDKFEGDAVMAFWGAPVLSETHAEDAIRTGLESIEELKELNKIFASNGLPELGMRIGINTGDMIVGNIGSSNRFEYTVIGDAVNLAARLEGINKQYNTQLICGSITKQLAENSFIFRKLDIVRVKGKKEPTEIFEVIGEKEDLSEFEVKRIEKYNDGLEYYLKGNFKEALKIFEGIKNDPPSEIFIDRCLNLIKHPPEKWDGIINYSIK